MSKPGILSSVALSTPVSVLLAEYHDDTRALYGDYLKRAGCTVEEAADGREALAKAITRRYDVVITETRLPGIDGYSLCQLLRRDASTMSTPVIVVTGDAMLCDLERARAAGADATLVKPCLPQALLEEMQKLMERRQSRQENVDSTAARADDNPPAVERAGARRPILSRIHRRGPTTTPPLAPPNLRCPVCDK
jgi:two-component system cell cycle response regulator DivK